ncbi:hypothetical protein NKH48_17635 [Mesorhizobium sp. M1233]|uniref:hypothetical protein n=1 Tax=Mesorhizobium sp. M1233 TaxID=2957072 RepID=UPI003335877F
MIIVIVGIALSGCTRGVAEFQAYVQASDAQFRQGTEVLDRMAVAERIVAGRLLARRSPLSFDPSNARYYTDVGDPPLTMSFRASLQSIKAYNDAVAALANGEAAAALSNRLVSISTNLEAAGTAMASANSQGALGATATAFLGQGSAAVAIALPVFRQIATLAGRETFRRQLVVGFPAMRDLLLALRNATPAMYDVMSRSYREPGSTMSGSGLSQQNLIDLGRDRRALAGWVILVDQTVLAMDAAAASAASGSGTADVAALAEASVEIRILAEQIKANQNRVSP